MKQPESQHILVDHASRYYPHRRLACRYCNLPILWDRDGLCASCQREMLDGFYDHVATTPKPLLPMKGTP